MGVPAFFRWLANRYPCVMLDLLEGKERGEFDRSTNASLVKETSGDFARWVQVDNLFIDCNGVVHPCCHPENGAPQPKNEREMLENVGKYLDRLVAAVRPTKLVYLALDGCAPRAKMNQQRERRFCSAREAEESARAMGELLKRQGHKPSSKQRWDHNAITPGTPFMDSLATYCRTWASKAVAKQPSLRVIISDASTPGEGEHKIMDHIRRCGGEDERHAVCGQDADLMFLSLALHAPRVYVLRERVNTGRSKSTGPPRLQYLSAQRLRHCLVRDPGINGLCTTQLDPRNKLSRFERDDERLLDDFVLLCFFVGNDFLPQLPCLSIPDGGLDLLLALYSRALPRSLGGYLTDDGGERGYPCGAGRVHVKRVAALLAVIADLEPEILRRRARRDAQSSSKKHGERSDAKKDALVEMAARACGKFDALSLEDDDLREPTPGEAASTKHLAERAVQKHAEKLLKESDLNDPCIGQKGFRERYYRKVLKHGPVKREGVTDRESAIRDLSVEYWRGVRFVAEYYHRGCASWSWCYPWHYAPLARDLARVALEPGEGLRKCCTRFERGAPLPPLQQLMCVLPPASAHCCPRAAQRLMTDQHSPLAKYYPRDFPLDPNGKPANLRWLWVALVPPIDVQVVASTFAAQIQPTLTPDERRRNRNGPAELVCAIPPNAGTNWVALAESDSLQGSVRLLDHVRVAYRPPEMAPNEPPYQFGGDATEDLLADPRLYQNQGRAPRLPIGDEAFRKAMSDVDAMAKRGGRPPAVPVPHKVVPCRYFLQGKCHRGAACTFKHIRPDGSEVCEPVSKAPKPPVVKVLKKPPQPPPAPAP
mmetsp:Transcript_22138/g.57757  ORF Transcript_22138/g.57757 Transcript_22138/m.57757 type:complete len:823 (+) Transcript_22138:203-2671(+)